MSSNKKITVKTEKATEIDIHILKLKTQLEENGVFDDELIIAVAKIYANSTLIAYKDYYGV